MDLTPPDSGAPQLGPVAERVASGIGAANVGRLAAWFGIVILVLYMTVGGGSGWLGLYSTHVRIASLTALVLVFVTWLVVAIRSPGWRPATHLAVPIAAVLGAFAASTALSWNPRLSLEAAAYAVVLAGLYLLLVRLIASAFFAPRLYALAASLAVLIAAWYLWTVVGLWATWWSLVGRITVPPLRPGLEGLVWGSPNTVAIMLALLVPAAVAYTGVPGRRRTMLALGAFVLLALVTIVITGSRGAWFGIAAGTVVTVGAWLAMPGHFGSVRARLTTLPIGRGAAIVLVVLGMGGLAIAVPLLVARLSAGGEDLRGALVATALRMFGEAPLTGGGPGTWVARRVTFTAPDEIDYYIPHAHNIVAQTLAEFGVLGVLVGAVVVVWLGALIAAAVRDAHPRRRRFGWTALFVTVYLAAHQQVDLYVGVPCVLFAYALTIGFLDAPAGRLPLPRIARRFGIGRRGARATGGVLGVGLAAALAFLAWSESNALPADAAVAAANAGDWTTARSLAAAAVAGDPGIPAYHLLLGLAALHSGDLAVAQTALERSASADDYPIAWLDLAAARLEGGDTDGARAALERALRVGHQQPPVAFAAGVLLEQLGDRERALEAFAAALTMGPTLVEDPYFTRGPGSGFREQAAERVLADRPDDWEIALLIGDPVAAALRAETLPGNSGVLARTVIDAWNGDPAARERVHRLADASPLDPEVSAWASRLARRAGDDALARRFRERAEIVRPGAADLALDLRVDPPDGLRRAYGSVDPLVHGLYAYRRPLPSDLLAPSLPRLRFT